MIRYVGTGAGGVGGVQTPEDRAIRALLKAVRDLETCADERDDVSTGMAALIAAVVLLHRASADPALDRFRS